MGFELKAPKLRIDLLERAARHVKNSGGGMKAALNAIKATMDFGQPAYEAYDRIQSRSMKILFEETRAALACAHEIPDRHKSEREACKRWANAIIVDPLRGPYREIQEPSTPCQRAR